MALTLPSRALIDALAQRGILAPKANAIRREGTNMNSAHEDVPKFEPPDPGMEPPPLYGRALLDSMPTLGAGFGPSLAMSPAPRRMAPAPSIEDAIAAMRLEPPTPQESPYVHQGLSMDAIPEDRLLAGAGNLEGPLADLSALRRPEPLPRLEFGGYGPEETLTLTEPSPFEAALGRRLPPRTPIQRSGSGAAPFIDLSANARGMDVSDPFAIEELTSSPEFEETGTFDFGDGPSRMFNRVRAPESIDDQITQAATRYDRTGDPEDLNTLGALLKVREQDSKASGGLSFEERLALKEAEPPGLAEGRRTNAEIQKSKLKFSEEQQKFLNDLRAKKADQQRVESQMRLIEAQADDARWKIENSDDDQEVQRAAQMLRGLVGYRNEIMSVLQGTQAPTGGEEPKPGAPAGQKPTGAPAAKKGQPTQADYQKAEAEINAKNPGLSDSERLDAILDLLEEQGFSVFDSDEPDS